MARNYTLSGVERAHRESPRTFSIPRGEMRRSLEPGWLAKLVVEMPETVDNIGAERVWVEVRDARDGRYIGPLDSRPLYLEPQRVT